MGFGTLLGGYFLLLNFTVYYRFTDVLAALMMFYALYKLSGINQMFKSAAGVSALFSVFGFGELILAALDLFEMITITESLTSILAMVRCLIVGVMTVLMLLGMKSVSDEVGLKALMIKCNYLSYVTVIVYSFYIFLETASLSAIFSAQALTYIGASCIIATLALIIMNLTAIFGCYSKICMPKDNKLTGYEEKKSRFGFINKFRAHEEERRREYAEYKMEKYKKKANKHNGKK